MNSTVNELRNALSGNEDLRNLFIYLSGVSTSQPIPVERMLAAVKQKLTRIQMIDFCKKLDKLQIGNFVAGRRGAPSRMNFYFIPSSVGKAALGVIDNLIKMPPQLVLPEKKAPALGHSTHVTTTEEKTPFAVQVTSIGTIFLLGPTARKSDAEELIKYIQKMFLSKTRTNKAGA